MAVQAWCDAEMQRAGDAGEPYRYVSFSDAIAQMIDVASTFYADRQVGRFVPVADVFGPFWTRRRRPWIRIEANAGRKLRCARCRGEAEIKAARFRGIVREICAFFKQHSHCTAAVNDTHGRERDAGEAADRASGPGAGDAET